MLKKIIIIVGIIIILLFINNTRTQNISENITTNNMFTEDVQDVQDVEEVETEITIPDTSTQNNPPLFTTANVFIHVPHPEILPSCEDHTLVVPKQVNFPATSAVLTASIEKLMEITEDSMDEQGQNWVSNERGFSLQSVSIENTIAKIFLTHPSSDPYTSPCQVTWMKFQFEATANQYPTVSATQVYVNGQLI